MSEAKRSAFEKCKAARAAALQRKKEAAAAAKAAKENPPVAAPAAVEPAAVEPAPAPAEPEPEPEPAPAPPTPAPEPPTPVETQEEDEAFELLDPAELMQLLHKQQEMITSLHEDVKGIRAHQQDLSTSFTNHGVKQQYSLNFV
jgi:hypothetical protein